MQKKKIRKRGSGIHIWKQPQGVMHDRVCLKFFLRARKWVLLRTLELRKILRGRTSSRRVAVKARPHGESERTPMWAHATSAKISRCKEVFYVLGRKWTLLSNCKFCIWGRLCTRSQEWGSESYKSTSPLAKTNLDVSWWSVSWGREYIQQRG